MSKTIFLALIVFCGLLSCKKHEGTYGECDHDHDTTRITRSYTERLRNHFKQHEIHPKIVINNIKKNETEVKLPGHEIKWIGTHDETYISIDNNKLSLKNEITKNQVHNFIKDSLNLANNWSQIKLYKSAGRDIIAIDMSYTHCADVDCSSNFYLFYDTKNKTTNYFGAFRSDLGMNLYNFGDEKISFASQSHLTYPECDAKTFNLYIINDKGDFRLQTKKDGIPYEIQQFYSEEGFKEFERLEQNNWIKKIK